MNKTKTEVQDFQQRRKQNEQFLRRENDRTKDLLTNGLLNQEEQALLPIGFVCECSKLSCRRSIKMSVEEFRITHQYRNRFIIRPGHEQTDIETVMERNKDYFIVEKFV